MTETAYALKVNNRLAELAAKYKNKIADIHPQDGIPPPVVNNYVKEVAITDNLRKSSGPDEIIDVQPDYRNIILFLANNITREYTDLDFKPHPCLTPMALLAYELALVYSLALLNDDENVRKRRSIYSKEVVTDSETCHILDQVRNLYVPPFMFELLESLKTSTDTRKKNLLYVYSLACFDFENDFGRAFPINMFFKASFLIGSRSASADPNTILQAWLQCDVMTTPEQKSVYQYIAANLNDLYETNWLSEVLYQLFNPATNRQNLTRNVLNLMNVKSQQHPDVNIENINPYLYLLSLDPMNRTNTSKLLESLSNAVFENYPQSRQLGDLQNSTSVELLANHYYQNVITPTYYPHAITFKEKQGDAEKKSMSAYQNFFKVPKVTANVVIGEFPTDKDYYPDMYLGTGQVYNEADNPIKYIEETVRYPVNMNIRHFCPSDTRAVVIYNNIITGKLIELSELDSVAVPHPNPTNTVDKENSYFLESAVPITRIRPIRARENEVFDIVKRPDHSQEFPCVRIDLIDRTVDRLPSFGPLLTAHLPDALPGYHKVTNLNHTQFGCSSLGYTIPYRGGPPAISEGTRKITGWSSFRYLNAESYEQDNIHDRKYMIFNFRTLYGMNVTLQETRHPSIMIPIS